MEAILQLLHERNARETLPFVAIHEANTTLLKQVDSLQLKLETSDRELALLRQQLQDAALSSLGSSSKTTSAAAAAALKNEARLRNKLEKLQDEYNAKLKAEAEEQAEALQVAKNLGAMKDLNTAQEGIIANLKAENKRAERMIEHLTNQLSDAKSRTDLAEQQYDGLKTTIRSLQEENDDLRKENRVVETRMVEEKSKLVDEMNVLTEMVDGLKKEVDMLRSYKKTWWGGSEKAIPPTDGPNKKTSVERSSSESSSTTSPRKFGDAGIIVPTAVKVRLPTAHSMDGTCVRYDADGAALVATAGSDALVHVWDVNTGACKATLRGANRGHAILACDLAGQLVVGAGSDKTCRVWNLRTERMVHQLVGHAHKITGVRLFGGSDNAKAVLTASADRSLKLWDISRKTYLQTTTLRHGSTANCIDVFAHDTSMALSGHMDGGLRCWDMRTGERSVDIKDLHPGGITSVQFSPSNPTHVLTNGLDSVIQVIDLRTQLPLCTLRDPGYAVSHAWSRACYSPDGNYIAAGSNVGTGVVYVWKVNHGDTKLHAKLQQGHEAGVCGIDWGRGGNQQVATLDRRGCLVLWA